ncbi:GNAT family N-acetyltransferase [Sutcliffiella cohnii]
MNNEKVLQLKKILLDIDFKEKDGSYIGAKRSLDDYNIINVKNDLIIKPVKETGVDEFQKIWFESVKGTKEETTLEGIQKRFKAMESEIGDQYLENFHIVFLERKAIGIMTPMIEPDSDYEGRFFYTGLVPEARGKGLGKDVFRLSLNHLKKIGCKEVVDYTESTNEPLLRIYKSFGLEIFDEEISFYRKFHDENLERVEL